MSDLKPLPYYKWFWQDFRASRSVQRMTYIERGLYRELLDECWSEGSIPSDPASLAEICGCPVEVIADAWQVLGKCFVTRGKRLVNLRLESERTTKDSQRVNRMAAGRLGGIAKLNKINESLAGAKQVPSTCHIEEKSREEKRKDITPLTPQGGKKRSSSGMKFPIPEEMKEALTLLCSHWPRKGHTRQGEIYDCRVWSDPQDLWDAMNKYFPDDDKKLMINCGLVYLEKINPVKGKPCEGARAMKNFYGPTEAYWKFEKEAVEERGNQ